MNSRPFTNAIIMIFGYYRAERAGAAPVALRLHPKDLSVLLAEVDASTGWLAPDADHFMGMRLLVDRKCPEGFPVCLDAKAAAEAIEDGARWR